MLISFVMAVVLMQTPVQLQQISSLCEAERVPGVSVAQSLLTGPTPATSYVWEVDGPTLNMRLVQVLRRETPENCNSVETRADQNLCVAERALEVGALLFYESSLAGEQTFPRLARVDATRIELGDLSDERLRHMAFELLTEPDRFLLICEPRPQAERPPQQRPDDNATGRFSLDSSRFMITGDRADLVQTQLKSRSFATYAFTDNVREGAETWNFDIVLGRNWRYFSTVREPSGLEQVDVGLFGLLRQVGGDLENPNEEINEVSFGVALGGRLVRPSGYFSGIHIASGDIRYVTDFDGDARGVELTGRYDLPLGHLAGYGRWSPIAQTPFSFTWAMDAVFEGVWIDNPGEAFPDGFNDWRRLGGDASFILRWDEPDWPVTPALKFNYQIRDHLDSSGEADASLFTGALSLTPGDNAHVELSLEYLTGQDLLKLTERQQWSLKLGYRY